MKKLMFLVSGAVLIALSSFGQSPSEKGKIIGAIKDEGQKALESASVSLLNAKDSSSIKIIASDKTGLYHFDGIARGKYLVSATAVGHAIEYSPIFEISSANSFTQLKTITLKKKTGELKEIAVVGKKPFIEQKADRMVVNVDASPANAGSTVMDVLEKSPGFTVDKDGNISLKGKQGVVIMIDNKPTYLNATQLASYLKSLPSSAIEQLEIMTNPSAKYDAAGNSGIINIKTKKNKTKGFNGSITLTHTQGVYPKPGGSLNTNYRNGKFNVFLNAGYSHWEGFQTLDINRNYLNISDKKINSIFTQHTTMKFKNPEFNVKLGMDYYLSDKTTIGFVASGFQNNEKNRSTSNIFLKDASNFVDSIVYSTGNTDGKWKNGSFNVNFRHQFDSTGKELTADVDYIHYNSSSDQHFQNTTYNPDGSFRDESVLTGDLPSNINIYSFKTDYTHPVN